VTGLQTALDAKLDDSQASSYGLSILDDTDAATARTTLGLGTAATSASSAFATASHNHAASEITSGTVATARLGSGTANELSFLRGDQTWASPYLLVATLASDQATGANTTPVTLTNLVFTYAANSVYRIWFMGQVSPAAATTGCGFQFDLSSAVTEISVQFFHQLASTGTQSGGHSIADDASVGVSSGLPGTGVYPVTGFGLLRTAGNTGTAQLRFRSETTAVITAKAGLTLVVEKIA
jgi:hypothetical protein